MKVGMNIKIIIGIVGMLAVGFIGFQVLKVPSPDVVEVRQIVTSEGRRITRSPFVERTSETETDEIGTDTQQEEVNIEPLEIETTPAPDTVPTAESSDDEIREFQAWLSSMLEEEDALEEIEQEGFKAEDDEIDYDLERALITSMIEVQWGNSLETHDIEGYMSAIWEDGFFYVSDMGTPDNLADDLIFRSGMQEREGTLKMFDAFHGIDLSLSKNGDIEFLSETLAMVDYDYDLKLTSTAHGVSYPSGHMIFILELRENGEWRILEWYDYATPYP